MSRPRTLPAKMDLGVANRLQEVRVKYIHKNQTKANEMLKMATGKLSLKETGKEAITHNFLKKLEPFNINPNYILFAEKPVLLNKPDKSNTLIDVRALNDRLDKMENQNKIMTGVIDKLWELISRHEKSIDKLVEQLEQLKRG